MAKLHYKVLSFLEIFWGWSRSKAKRDVASNSSEFFDWHLTKMVSCWSIMNIKMKWTLRNWSFAFIILFILKINVPTTLERNKKGDLVIQVGFKTYKKSVIKRSFLATLFITFCLTPQHFYRRQFQGPSNRKWLDAYLYW